MNLSMPAPEQLEGLLTCTFYLNEDWDAERDGGEIRLCGA